MTENAIEQTSRPKASGLFRVVWRWHFWAGLFTAPFLIVLSLTGMIYLFGAEIEDAARSHLIYVQPKTQRVPPATMLRAAEAHLPDWNATVLLIPWEADRAALVTMVDETGEREYVLSVDPYSASILGSMDHRHDPVHNFFHVVLDIHRSLFIGTPGRVITEVVTCWVIILLCTGIFLWWPRRREKIRGVWTPRLRGKWYVVLRDLHSVSGIYLLPIMLVIVTTGLFYTIAWGTAAFGISTMYHAGWDGLANTSAPMEIPGEPKAPPGDRELNVAYQMANERYPQRAAYIAVGGSSSVEVKVTAMNDYARGTYGRFRSAEMLIHPHTREVVQEKHLADHPGYGWHGWVYPLHVGSIGGPYTKVLWLLACIVLFSLPVTGIWMWWKRRPAGQAGFPRRPSQELPGWLIGLIVVLGISLPLAGLSLLIILTLERMWMRE